VTLLYPVARSTITTDSAMIARVRINNSHLIAQLTNSYNLWMRNVCFSTSAALSRSLARRGGLGPAISQTLCLASRSERARNISCCISATLISTLKAKLLNFLDHGKSAPGEIIVSEFFRSRSRCRTIQIHPQTRAFSEAQSYLFSQEKTSDCAGNSGVAAHGSNIEHHSEIRF
jgi:hypothetical protein